MAMARSRQLLLLELLLRLQSFSLLVVLQKTRPFLVRRKIGFLLEAIQLFGGEIQQLRVEIPVMGPGPSVGTEHFVISRAQRIIAEGGRHLEVSGLCWRGHYFPGRLNQGPFDGEQCRPQSYDNKYTVIDAQLASTGVVHPDMMN